MAAFVSSVRKGLLSCGILPFLRTVSTSVKCKAQDVNIRMVNFQNLKTQIRRISTFSFLANVSRISTGKMSFQSRQLVGVQSIYRFGSSSDFLKRTEGFVGYNKKTVVITRHINTKSKLGKRKTCKAVTKRFIRTGKGKLKRWRAGKNHKMMHKGPKRSMRLRKATYVNKQQLKLLNKMVNGW